MTIGRDAQRVQRKKLRRVGGINRHQLALNPKAEIDLTEANKEAKVPTASGVVTNRSIPVSPTCSGFVLFVDFCESTSVLGLSRAPLYGLAVSMQSEAPLTLILSPL